MTKPKKQKYIIELPINPTGGWVITPLNPPVTVPAGWYRWDGKELKPADPPEAEKPGQAKCRVAAQQWPHRLKESPQDDALGCFWRHELS
jgi:hypothetical protein